ncbi:MAG: amidohydrolase family protein [Candidatus Eisenbacteria bacterium]|nr:amidohydrolase family protein [Candidatus Eisenbacteria bacterium]
MKCIHAKRLYTGTSVLDDAYLLFDGREIAGVSRTKKGTMVGKFALVTPAFIDPHSHIGMYRTAEPEAEGEGNDEMQAILALSDALDSVQMDDAAFAEAVEMGVLYSCVVPGSGNIIGGRSAVIRHYAKNTNDALFARAGVKAAFGFNPMSVAHRGWKGERPTTRMGAVAILRAKLHEVQQKMEKEKRAKAAASGGTERRRSGAAGEAEKKAREEAAFTAADLVLREVLEGKQVLRVHVHKIDDIAALLRVVDDFKLRITIEHAGDVHQPEIFVELKRRGIPVIYGPTDGFAYKVELKHDNWRNVKHLVASGVEYGLMTDHPFVLSKMLLTQTRWFLRAGVTKQQAVELVSRKNAQLIGVDRMLGTLDKGRWASFVCWNGDPFDISSYPVAVYGEGRLLFSD